MLIELLLCVTPMAFLGLDLNKAFHEDPEWPPKKPARPEPEAPKPDPLAGFAPLQMQGGYPADRPAPLQAFAAPPSSNAPLHGYAPRTQPVEWLQETPPVPASPSFFEPLAAGKASLRPDDPRVKQLRALDAAVDAGVLSEAEGAARRRTILATPPPPPPIDLEAVRRRRAAILSALDAEIISRDEADVKLAQLPPLPDAARAEPQTPELLANLQTQALLEPKRAEPAPIVFGRKTAYQAEPQPAPVTESPAPLSAPAANEPAPVGAARGAAPDPLVQPSTLQPATSPTEAGDSRGRFRLTLPAGWAAQDEAGTLRLTFGDAWAIFETSSEPGRPVDVAQRHAEKMRPFYNDWKVVNGGPFTTKRQRQAGGWTVTASWTSGAGEQREAVLLVWSVNAGGDRFVTMTSSADSAVAQQANPALMSIFDSLKFSGE